MKIKAKKQTKPVSDNNSGEDDNEFDLEIDDNAIPNQFGAAVQRWMNNPQASIERLMRENFKYREKNRDLNQRIKTLEAEHPKEGEGVITQDEVKELEAYRALGKPDDLKAQATELTTLREKSADVELQGIAQDAGYKYPVLLQLAKMSGLNAKNFQSREIEIDGKKIKVMYVVKFDDKGNQSGETKLSEFAQSNWKDFLPSLLQSNKGNDGDTSQVSDDDDSAGSEEEHQVLNFPSPSKQGKGEDSFKGLGDSLFSSNFNRFTAAKK